MVYSLNLHQNAPWNNDPYTYDKFKLNVGGTYSIYGNFWVGENHQERKQTKFGKEWIHQILGYIDFTLRVGK